MFTVKGLQKGEPWSVTWDNGTITGTQAVVLRVQLEAKVLSGEDVGPPEGPFTRENHLKSPISTLLIIQSVAPNVTEITGDIPERPPIPKGAIG